MTDEEPQFAVPGCTCRPFTHRNGESRYLDRPGDTVDMVSGWETKGCPLHDRKVPKEARLLCEELRVEILRELYMELREEMWKNPYRLGRAQRRWAMGMNAARDLVFHRILRAEARVRALKGNQGEVRQG